ncbi:hypothetical protein ABW19_dt0207045 [Dactylella cylindrospora]|nr:hypothetical protein ABW19_dt0207045 [Dactylella cylindrospora]
MMVVDSDKLASLGLALQYEYKELFNNLTAVELADELRQAILRDTLYLGKNATELVSLHVHENLTNAEAAKLLEEFNELDHDRWPWLAVPWITLTIVGGLFVIMRLFTRIKYCGGLRRDDYFLILAYICSLGNNTEDIWLALEANWPAHIWDKTLEEARLHRLWGLMDGYWWFTGKGAVMMSLLFFYHDLYPGRKFRIACWIMMFLTLVWTIGGLLLAQLPCKPYDSWNYLHVFECIPGYIDIASAHTIFNIVLDCCVL